jgi:hypothetical protein
MAGVTGGSTETETNCAGWTETEIYEEFAKNATVKLFLWKKDRSAQEINNDGVSNGENSGSV